MEYISKDVSEVHLYMDTSWFSSWVGSSSVEPPADLLDDLLGDLIGDLIGDLRPNVVHLNDKSWLCSWVGSSSTELMHVFELPLATLSASGITVSS